MRPAEGKEAQLPVMLTEGRKDNEALRGQKWTTQYAHSFSSNLRFDRSTRRSVQRQLEMPSGDNYQLL